VAVGNSQLLTRRDRQTCLNILPAIAVVFLLILNLTRAVVLKIKVLGRLGMQFQVEENECESKYVATCIVI
jgi:hypothetical protein